MRKCGTSSQLKVFINTSYFLKASSQLDKFKFYAKSPCFVDRLRHVVKKQ